MDRVPDTSQATGGIRYDPAGGKLSVHLVGTRNYLLFNKGVCGMYNNDRNWWQRANFVKATLC